MYRRTSVTIIAGLCVAAFGAMLLIPGGREVAVADTAQFTSTTSAETIATIDAMLGNSNPLPAAPDTAAAPLPAATPDPDNFQTAALTASVAEPEPVDPNLRADSVGGSAVNLRAGPSSSSATVTVLQPGQPLHAGASQGGWIEVTLDDGTKGWVYSRYLASVAADSSAEAAGAAPDESGKAVVKGNSAGLAGRTARIDASLTVRSKPSDGAHAMFRTEPGERVRILDVQGNWLRIRTADGSSGWIERAS